MNEIICAEDGEVDSDATMRAATVSCFTVEAVDGGALISWPRLNGRDDVGRGWVWQSHAQAEDILNKLQAAVKTADV